MDELIETLMAQNKWPFKFHYTEDGQLLTAPNVEEPPLEEALF